MKIEKMMLESIMKNPEAYVQDFINVKQSVSESKAIYKGAPVPYLYVPKIYTPEDVNSFQDALAGIMDICDRTISLYVNNPEIRGLFGFDPRLEELILLPHGYDRTVPMGRFDIFYYGPGSFRFCELNADGASAMNEEKELSSIISNNKIVDEYRSAYDFKSFELFNSWVAEVGEIYGDYLKKKGTSLNGNHKTVVAIVDFIDKSSPIEFEVFKEAFEAAGYKAVIADPREITCENGRMIFEGLAIDVVYRRLVTKDLMDRYDEIPGFISGLKSGETCVIGSVKTQVIHTKRFFEMLYHPEVRKHFTREQIDFIDAHVPMTMPLEDFGPDDVYLTDKDKYIIKPVDYYASKGVIAGSDLTMDQWRDILTEKVKEDYIIQAYCPVSMTENVLYNDTALQKYTFRTITGLFVYNGKFAGVYVRAGLNAIISGLHEGYTMATLVAEKR